MLEVKKEKEKAFMDPASMHALLSDDHCMHMQHPYLVTITVQMVLQSMHWILYNDVQSVEEFNS